MSTLYQSLIRWAFELLYTRLAWTYDAVSWAVSLGAWRDWQRASLAEVRGPDVLELGHGPGHMLVQLGEAGFRLAGVDVSPQMGRLAAGQLRSRSLAVPLIRAPAQALPLAAGSFDTVLATFPTPYILEPATLASIAGVLRPGGRLVIVPGARLTGSGPLVRLIDWLYAITGQNAEAAGGTAGEVWQRRIGESGGRGRFGVTAREVSLPGSVVTVIVAELK